MSDVTQQVTADEGRSCEQAPAMPAVVSDVASAHTATADAEAAPERSPLPETEARPARGRPPAGTDRTRRTARDKWREARTDQERREALAFARRANVLDALPDEALSFGLAAGLIAGLPAQSRQDDQAAPGEVPAGVDVVEPAHPELLDGIGGGDEVQPAHPELLEADGTDGPSDQARQPAVRAPAASPAPKKPSPRAARTFRDRLHKATTATELREAVESAREAGLEELEEYVERVYVEKRDAAGNSREAKAAARAWAELARAQLAATPPDAAHDTTAEPPTATTPKPAATAAPEGPTYMGQPVDRLKGVSATALWLVDCLTESTRGKRFDLTRAVQEELFVGTPAELRVDASPRRRLTELLTVKLAQRAESASATVEAMAGELGAAAAETSPTSVLWEALPFAVALGASIIPNPVGALQAAASVYVRGAKAAARGAGRVVQALRRRRA